MATAKRTKNDFIFTRSRSQNWCVRLRDENGKRFIKSLGTTDRREADLIAMPLIERHKARLLAARPHIETVWIPKLEPGREHTSPDGGRIVATERELIHLGHNGSIIKTEPNGGLGAQIASRRPLTLRSLAEAFDTAGGPIFGDPVSRLRASVKNSDDAILQTYLDHGGRKRTGVHGHFRNEAQNTWAIFRRLTDNKPLKNCTRDDGRKLVAYFQNEGLKSATIAKKVAWLCAAVNLAIGEGRFTSINPFSSVAPEGDDKSRRLPLSDDDIAATKRALGSLEPSDQILFRLLACTGMRLSEAFEVDNEMTEKGVRYVIVGRKTPQSERRVPFPADLLAYLPKKIKGPLFPLLPPSGRQGSLERSAAVASKRLNRFLRDAGIDDERKVLHSLRHRAQDQLRAAECPQDMRWALLGHEEKTVAAGYGVGFSVPQLKKWIDRIGY
jgi:integrase